MAESGTEAMRLHDARPADVVVSDWQMGGMDGLDLCRILRARDSDRGTYTYLLFVSGRADKRDFVEAIRAGADGYFPKPVDLDELEASLLAARRVVRAYRELADKNAGLREDSQLFFRSARVDALTGIPNRLRLDEDIVALQAQMLRYGHGASVAMCDIDTFKQYNDHFGHIAGDEALRRIAQAIRDSLRTADDVYRYGGEEFLVVLREQSGAAAAAAIERVRGAVEGLAIEHAPGAAHTVLTVSAGVASVGHDKPDSVRTAIRDADHALFRAKALGGNRVQVHPVSSSLSGG
jgi:two-component system, cell cycle response regulator